MRRLKELTGTERRGESARDCSLSPPLGASVNSTTASRMEQIALLFKPKQARIPQLKAVTIRVLRRDLFMMKSYSERLHCYRNARVVIPAEGYELPAASDQGR